MKAFKKLALVAVLLTAAFGFVSCSDDDDDDPSVVTTWAVTYTNEDKESETDTLYFYDDNTATYTMTISGVSATFSGTYTGDTTKAGAAIVAKLT